MADRNENEIKKFIAQQRITEEEAKNASSISELVERATNGAIKSANPKYDFAGTNVPYSERVAAESKYRYISDDIAKKIVGGSRNSTSHGIWKQVNSPSWMGGNVQYTVDQVLGMKQGDILLGLDIETLGTAGFQGGSGNFGITQIAAVPYQVDFQNTGGPLVRMPGEPVNILTKPDKRTMDWLRQTVQELKQSKGVVPKLTAEQYRSLKDLIAYAGDARFGDAAGVILKTNSMAIPDGVNLKRYIGLIEKGLDNLENKALSVTQAMDTLNQKMFKGGYKLGENFKYFTFNGLGFDLPALNEATGGKMPVGLGHVDIYEASKQAYGDIFSAFYRDRNTKSVRAIGRLENVFEAVFGMSMEERGLRAHYGVDDTIGMGELANRILPDIRSKIQGGMRTGRHDLVGRYGRKMSSSVEYQMNVIENGATLFARSSAFKGSEMDSVIDMNNKRSVVRKTGPAIYKNRTYSVVDQFVDNGHFSVLLHNREDDVYHVIGRKTKEELQSVIQRNFVPYDKDTPGYNKVRAYSAYDSARREYESMFVGEGSYNKAKKYMGALGQMQAVASKDISKMSQKEFQALAESGDFGLSATQKRNMGQFYKRLAAEAPTINGFLSELDKAKLNKTQKDIAMGNFKGEFDAAVGAPTKDLRLPNMVNQVELFVPGPKGGLRRGVDATNFSTLEAGIRSILEGSVKESSMNFSNVVDNFNQVVSDLVGRGVIGMNEGKKLLNDSARFLANRGDKTSGVMYLSQLLANNVGNKIAKVNAIEKVADLSATSHMVHGLQNPSALYSNAIGYAKNMITYSNKGLAINKEARQFIDSFHKEKVMAIQKATGLPSTKMPAAISKEIEGIAKSLAEQDVYMNLYVDKSNNKGLQLALYSKEHAQDVMRNGLKSKHIAKAYIPLAENDMLIAGGSNKANIMYAVMGNSGDPFISTTQHQILFKLKYSQDRIIDAMKMGNLNEASRVMTKAVHNAINPLSTMSRYADVKDELDFSSRGANWIRNSYVNVSPLMDKVLGRHGTSFGELTLDQSNDLITDILHGAGSSYKTPYGKEIQRSLKGLHLNLGVASVKTELLNQGIFATADARWLVPLGGYSPATRESIRQAQNYYSLNAANVDPGRINPLIMTDVASEVYGGEITGLSVKTARMNDTALKQLVGERWSQLGIGAQPSTYEQMGLMKESVARQFGTFKRKLMYIEPGNGLEVNPAIARRLAESGSLSVDGTTVLGQAITDADGKPIEGAGRSVKYESKYGSIIRGLTLDENGRYTFDIDEFVPSTRGTKFITESGVKFTQRIITDEAWASAFAGLEDIDVIMGGEIFKSKKQPATIHMLSALKNAVDEYLNKTVTTGSVERSKAEQHVVNVIGQMLGSTSGIRFEDYSMGDTVQRVLMMPGKSSFKDTLRWGDVYDTIKNGLGVNPTRKVGAYDVDIGLTTLRKSMVEEYPEFIGSARSRIGKFEGVNWGMRELEMIRTRYMRYNMSGTGPDISALYSNIKSNMLNLTAAKIQENRGIMDIVGQTLMGKLEGDYATISLEDIDNIKSLATKEKGNTISDFAGTILDNTTYGGKKGALVALPEKFKVGNSYIDQIYMPNISLEGKAVNGIVHPNVLQGQQLGIIEDIKGYRYGMAKGETELAERSYNRIQERLNKYIVAAGAEAMGSQGSIAKDSLGGALKHSGRTIAAGYGIADYFDEAGNILTSQIEKREGHIGLSESAFREMLSGVGDSDIRKLIELSGGETSGIQTGRKHSMNALIEMMSNPDGPGLAGIIGRNPTIGQGSVLAVKYHVDPMASRNSFLTVGVATALRADYDGDYVSHLLPYFGGAKAKELNVEAFKATNAMYDADIGMLQRLAGYTLDELSKDIGPNSDKSLSLSQIAAAAKKGDIDDLITSHFDNPMSQMLETQSRLLKSVGQYSNMSYALRRSAETLRDSNVNVTVGKYQMYEILGAFGEQIEQKPISSKKLEDLLDKAGVSSEEKSQRLQEYVDAQRRLRTTDIYDMNVESIISDAKAVGILNGDGSLTGHYGVMLESKLGDMGVGEKELTSALTDVKNLFSKNGLYDPSLRLFSSQPSTVEQVFNIYEANMDPSKVLPTPQAKLLHQALDMEFDEERAAENASRRILKDGSTVGGISNRVSVHEGGAAMRTLGGDTAERIVGSVNKIFGEGSTKVAGVAGFAALGVWTAVNALTGPSIDHQPVEAHSDQAPSADGTYVNQNIFAGAPAGAGPTARVSPRGGGYERVNVNIRGNVNMGMTNDEVSQLISEEIRRQSGIEMNLKITSEDNRQTIDRQWLQDQFSVALKSGYVY